MQRSRPSTSPCMPGRRTAPPTTFTPQGCGSIRVVSVRFTTNSVTRDSKLTCSLTCLCRGALLSETCARSYGIDEVSDLRLLSHVFADLSFDFAVGARESLMLTKMLRP